jgi:hypothetical protein
MRKTAHDSSESWAVGIGLVNWLAEEVSSEEAWSEEAWSGEVC